MKFSEYLKYIRERRGLNKSELSKRLGVTSGYIINIENGKAKPPTKERLIEIAKILNASDLEKEKLIELAFQEKIIDKSPDWFVLEKHTNKIGKKDTPSTLMVPIISWVKANRFDHITDPYSSGSADEYVTTTSRGEHMFALKVTSHCMEPEFREGDIIIVNPSAQVNNGDYVVVKDTKAEKATFKQYKIYGKKIILHPLNPAYQDIELDHKREYQIVGKVVEKVKKY